MKILFLILSFTTLILSYDISDDITVLDSPYEKIYSNKKTLYARNIWDMLEFEQKLYLGAGNSSNIGPAQNAGPLPLISYNPSTNEFKKEALMHDEQIDIIKTFKNTLYIPGHDATQNWEYANIYIKEQGKAIKKYRNIKNGLHVYDIAFFDNKIFTALGVKSGAAVGISEDNGASWKIDNLNHYRIYGFLEVADRLFAVKFFPSLNDFKNMSRKRKKLFFSVAEYKDNRFEPLYDLSFKDFFPMTDNLTTTSKKIVRPIKIDNRSLYIGAFIHNDHQAIPFGVYYAQIINDKLISKKVTIPENEVVWDTLYKDNIVYLLSYNKIRERATVFHTTDDNLDSFKELISFKSSTFARSFEYINGVFYFSLGAEIKNPKNFNYNEIDKDTGKILVFDTKNINN